MSTHTGPKPTEAEGQQRRRQQRERLEQACRELLSTDGWRRWVKARSAKGLGRYSFHSQCLLAVQARERSLELSYVAGFSAFLTLGRAVRKGERALWVLAPYTVTIKRQRPWEQSDDGETEEEHRVFFRSVPVFDAFQTEEIPGADITPLCPPGEPVDGGSHAYLIHR
jgi:antirestriction protein ArdC